MTEPPPRNEKTVTGLSLLVALLVSLLILPLFEGLQSGRTIFLIGLSAIFLCTALSASRNVRLGAFVFVLIALPASWATLFIQSRELFVVHCILGSVLSWIAGGWIVYSVFRSREVALDSIFNAISAYLLFGLAWALTYWAIDTQWDTAFPQIDTAVVFESGSAARPVEFSHYIYYSFVTMSTLGYGDITPSERVTRTFSWIQSVTGQFYVAVVIAWLVTSLPQPEEHEYDPS